MNYCKNGGLCQKVNHDYVLCNCTAGFSGHKCETKESVDVLLIASCAIGGLLVLVILSAVILCYCKL